MVLPDEDRELLERFKRGQKTEKRLVFKVSIILACSSGKTVKEIASELYTRPNTVLQWGSIT
jgi:DNA-binding NarL/FixJ family response regulator